MHATPLSLTVVQRKKKAEKKAKKRQENRVGEGEHVQTQMNYTRRELERDVARALLLQQDLATNEDCSEPW